MFPCFETLLVIDGVAQRVGYHAARMQCTLSDHGMAWGDVVQELNEALQSIAGATGRMRCRVEYDGSGVLAVRSQPYVPTVPQSIVPVKGAGNAYCYKWCDRSVLDGWRALAGRVGGDEALIVCDGKVTDTTIANVAFWDGMCWVTPDRPLLPGTMRQQLLEQGVVVSAPVFVDAVSRFRAMAVMNALLGFRVLNDGVWRGVLTHCDSPLK